MDNKKIAASAISSILALGILTATSANAVPSQPAEWENVRVLLKQEKMIVAH